jgi:hypothetical protein
MRPPISGKAGDHGVKVMLTCAVAVAVIFYALFKPVNRSLALLGFAFRLVMTAILGVNMLARSAPLLLLRDVASSAALGTDQMHAGVSIRQTVRAGLQCRVGVF